MQTTSSSKYEEGGGEEGRDDHFSSRPQFEAARLRGREAVSAERSPLFCFVWGKCGHSLLYLNYKAVSQ